MKIVHKIEEVRTEVAKSRKADKKIGLVPTMGALHAGHGSLIEAAVAECDYVIVTIFINPTQFAPSEDMDKYPRTLDADTALCEKLGASLFFAPSADVMYPDPQLSWVDVEKLTDHLCGASRPGHFRGVTTVCTKLFNITTPDIAYFGQKDAQQALVIRRMVADLNTPLEIKVCPIIREPDGLAMSSRNQYLSTDQRKRALCLNQALTACKEQIEAGQRNASILIAEMESIIQKAKGDIDYITITDPQTLEPIETIKNKALIALAVKIGQTRLIDNVIIEL
ncbi:MAG: pantoate--beta-alanine ligase [Planctomycetota bacterium]|jgi:pantoate--beta-alanine ligase